MSNVPEIRIRVWRLLYTGPPPAQSILLILRDVKSAQLRARAPVGRREVVPSPPSWDHLPTAKGGTNRRSLDAAYAALNLFFMSTCGELRKGRAIVPFRGA